MLWLALAALVAWLATGAHAAARASEFTAAQIIEKNVAARGGLDAWRKIETMVWSGHLESANAPLPSMPFVLEQQRPNKTRFEITAMNQRTLRVFDGAQGWKIRPGRDGRPDIQPYSPQELQFAQQAQSIDGPLIDYEAKGIAVALSGVDEIDGRKAYRLSVRFPSGENHQVWIDAQTFLEIRYDRTSYNRTGVPSTVPVFYHDYKPVEGLMIPFTIEIGADSGKKPDKMVIEKIALNSLVNDRTFAKPGARPARNRAVMQTMPLQSQMPLVPLLPAEAAMTPDPGREPK